MTVYRLDNLAEAIDAKIAATQGLPRHPGGKRRHLGASVLARECAREVWYSYRWATDVRFDGRMLRLFLRGQDEEKRFIEILDLVGIKVVERDYSECHTLWYHPESDSYVVLNPGAEDQGTTRECLDVTDIPWRIEHAKSLGVILPAAKQFRVLGYMQHFGGSLDGIATGVRAFVPAELLALIAADELFLSEFKTHGRKSYDALDMHPKGVRGVKPEHFGQMQSYMHGRKLRWALYCAVCKDTDRLYFELVKYDEAYALSLMARAQAIIDAKRPPARIHESPSWHGCKFCDHKPTCKLGVSMVKSCRTCSLVEVASGGRWFCTKWKRTIPIDAEEKGCDFYVQIDGDHRA